MDITIKYRRGAPLTAPHDSVVGVSVCVRVSKKMLHLIKLEGLPFQLKHGGQRRRHEREKG